MFHFNVKMKTVKTEKDKSILQIPELNGSQKCSSKALQQMKLNVTPASSAD